MLKAGYFIDFLGNPVLPRTRLEYDHADIGRRGLRLHGFYPATYEAVYSSMFAFGHARVVEYPDERLIDVEFGGRPPQPAQQNFWTTAGEGGAKSPIASA